VCESKSLQENHFSFNHRNLKAMKNKLFLSFEGK
jgi:hypothetical protein